ncbi:MAG: hypothetical protein ABIN89_28490 [Chitinophagaceae bacterium]
MKKRDHKHTLKTIVAILLLVIISSPAISQFYYKDLVTVQQTNETFRLYKSNKINKVTLNSFQGNVPVTEGFICEQKVNLLKNEVITYTNTLDLGESYFTAVYQTQGLLIKTIDSSQEAISYSSYQYDADSRLIAIHHSTRAADSSSRFTESHYWQYAASGKPQKMVRIRNNKDSTHVNFVTDDKGNVTEEEIVGKTAVNQKIYYYYDEKNRITDVVQYRQKAKRLLPDYMFEYEETGELSTMTIVPEGSSDYQKYYYKYDENGLKVIEFCYNKRNELMGKVQYSYSTGK